MYALLRKVREDDMQRFGGIRIDQYPAFRRAVHDGWFTAPEKAEIFGTPPPNAERKKVRLLSAVGSRLYVTDTVAYVGGDHAFLPVNQYKEHFE